MKQIKHASKKYWVRVQQSQSYFMVRSCLYSLVWPPFPAIFGGVDITKVPRCYFLHRWVFTECLRNYFKDWCLMNSQPTFLIFNSFLTQLAILSEVSEPDNFESHDSLKLSFVNIWGLWSNFIDRESFRESNSPDVIALC